jgi:hypothetical protein
MKEQTKLAGKAFAVLLTSAVLGFAQVNSMPTRTGPPEGPNNANYPIQAPMPAGAGSINYVEGQAYIDGETLSLQSVGSAVLEPNRVLNTRDGYAEVLLTPGAFLRVGYGSEVRMLSAGLADTRVQLVRGTAMVEVDQMIIGTHLALAINGPGGQVTTQIEKKGLYDFDATQQAVKVLDGKATVASAAGSRKLGKGDQVLLASDHPLKSRSFNESTVKAQPLYVWSKARSEDEAQASIGSATNAGYYAAAGPGWYWDPYLSFYGFWPTADLLYSPFGWSFYSPGFFGYYSGYGWYGHPGWHGHVGGVSARIGGFHGGGFHGGGFRGGSFHGGGGHR